MSGRRFWTVFRIELRYQVTRPLFWVLVALLVLSAWGLSSGDMTINTGSSDVGGKKAFITSGFAMALVFSVLGLIYYTFFAAIIAGLAIVRDDELKVGEVLHSTRLTPGEYIWAKFSSIVAVFLLALGLQILFHIFFNHVLPNASAVEHRGPFHLGSYLVPGVLFGVPSILFFCGTALAIGERSRKPILIFVLPVIYVVLSFFFFMDWSPSWLDPRINHLIMLFDVSGFRWLNDTWLKVDRGVDFYNTAPFQFDGLFLLNRLLFVAIGVGSVFLARRSFARSLRGARKLSRKARREAAARFEAQGRIEEEARVEGKAGVQGEAGSLPAGGPAVPEVLAPSGLGSLAMRVSPPGFLRTAFRVARFESKNLRGQAGLYLFIPLILWQAIQNGYLGIGPFDTPLLVTPGAYAAHTMNTLTLLVTLLILFFTVESLVRERTTGLAPIFYASPSKSGAILLGKALANSVVGVVILLAALLGGVVIMVIQGKVGFQIRPFAVLWGLLLVPTFLVWSAFVMAVYSLVRNRYTSYAVGLGVLVVTGLVQVRGWMTWVGNWDLWSAVGWTDFDSVAPNALPLLLNRLFYLSLGALFIAVAVRFFPRSELDSGRMVDRLRFRPAFLAVLRTSPLWVPALVLGILLDVQVQQGFQGKAVEKRERDYWRKNLTTWLDKPSPYLAGADVDLTLDPDHSFFQVKGTYALYNPRPDSLDRFCMSVGDQFRDIRWTLDGEDYQPEDRERLFVFTPPRPLGGTDTLRVGFSHSGQLPRGITKNGGGMGEFVLPCGVVLTSFSNSFLPTLGFNEERGVDPKHPLEAKEYPDDFFLGITPPGFGAVRPYSVRTRITGPARMEYHGVGVKVDETVENGRRTVVWQSDAPVNFFNVIGAVWDVWRGEGTAIYYHPAHVYNLEEMGKALDAARKYYSEWFYPYPWKELKVSEFPGLASYAQGFPSNISFSESIGFLTRTTKKLDLPFMVTAHESAHQWWGNLVLPGKGPGGNILSEGMAHFSTILLFDQVEGTRSRIEFCKRIEERYGEKRQVDSERPLVRIDGSRAGDETVTYDKGGWVFWMLHNLMGKKASLAGIQDFVRTYRMNLDHPVLQDYIAVLSRHAPDPMAFDAFVNQWFFSVVVPEFKIEHAKKTREKPGKSEEAQKPAVAQQSPVTQESAGTQESAEAQESAGSQNPGGVQDSVETHESAETGKAGEKPDTTAGAEKTATGDRWVVTASVRNAGTGTVTVDVAAVRGKRFEDDGSVSPEWREERLSVRLGPGESKDLEWDCDFEPERLVVDPDAMVLQLLRKSAVADL